MYEVWIKNSHRESVRLSSDLTLLQARELVRNLERSGITAVAKRV